MVQLRQGPLFAGEALAASRRNPGIAQNLNGDLGAKIFAFGEINHTHPTFAQQPQNSVRTEFLERKSGTPFDEGS